MHSNAESSQIVNNARGGANDLTTTNGSDVESGNIKTLCLKTDLIIYHSTFQLKELNQEFNISQGNSVEEKL